MANWGVAFRSSSGYVTNPADVYFQGNGIYPQNVGGINAGWLVTSATMANRDNTVAYKPLAGMGFTANDGASQRTWQADLPAGPRIIRLALGDALANINAYCQVLDGGVPVFTISGVGSSPTGFVDATGVDRAAAAWLADNVGVAHTFTGVCTIVIGSPTNVGNIASIAHVMFEDPAAPFLDLPPSKRLAWQPLIAQ